MLGVDQLAELLLSADAVVTHGGPGLIMEARAAGHCPIVVPRDLEAAGELERLATATADPAEGVREETDAQVVLVTAEPTSDPSQDGARA